MRLIGMLDSPYVRRVAISLDLLGIAYEHVNLSVFGDFDAIEAVNPLVKVPTLVTNDGVTLMDSTLILLHAEALSGHRIMPAGDARALAAIGLALAAAEKAVQIVYERRLRPAEKQFAGWLTRVERQVRGGFRALDAATDPDGALDHAGVTTACVWRFATDMIGDIITPAAHPALAALSAQAEATEAFRRRPPE